MRLPLRVQPLPDESITSMLRRAVRAADYQTADLPALTTARVDWSHLSVFTDRNTIRAIAHLTGLPAQTVKAATMHRYVEPVPALTPCLRGVQTVGAVARRTWLWPRTCQYCPDCLSDHPEVWNLAWHLPWTYECSRHRRLLITHCPRCGHLVTEDHACPKRSSHDVPGSSWPVCAGNRPRPVTALCSETEHHAATRIRAALDAQQVVAFGAHVDAEEYLETLRGLAGLIDHTARRRHGRRPTRMRRTVAAAPRPAAERARLLAGADQLTELSPTQASTRIAALLRRGEFGAATRTWVRDHTTRTTTLAPVLDEAIRILTSVGHARIPQAAVDPTHVPQAFWPQRWQCLRSTTTASAPTARSFASLTLVKAATGLDWIGAGALLGIPAERTTQIVRCGRRGLQMSGHQLLHALTQAKPDESPDFRRREQQARRLSADPDYLQAISQAVGHRQVMSQIITERLWLAWVLGHPALVPHHQRLTDVERRRLSNQRARWDDDDDALLIALTHEWLDKPNMDVDTHAVGSR